MCSSAVGRWQNQDVVVFLYAVRIANLPRTPTTLHGMLSREEEEPTEFSDLRLNSLGCFPIWAVRHRSVFPIDVNLPPLRLKEGLDAFRQVCVFVAMGQKGRLLLRCLGLFDDFGGLPQTCLSSVIEER